MRWSIVNAQQIILRSPAVHWRPQATFAAAELRRGSTMHAAFIATIWS
jgi:hypothetical protein